MEVWANKMKKIGIVFCLMLGMGSLFYARDITQRNPETIFLTEKSIADYASFQEKVLEKHSLVIKRENVDRESFNLAVKELASLCMDDCQIITQESLVKKSDFHSEHNELMTLEGKNFHALLVTDNTDDSLKKIIHFTKNNMFWNSPHTSYAGLPYTNYLLDEYSHSIQDFLFPAMFILGLVISILFIRKIKTALIVYLPCLFSAGFSLATIKYFYHDMNMVTSIIPLVVFTVILSLSFHLYFSLLELGTLKNVIKVKWAPIFLMMFTTYIGFLSLMWAEINVVRVFGLLSSQLVLSTTLFCFLWYGLFENKLVNVAIGNQTAKEQSHFFLPNLFKYSLPKWGILFIICISFLCAIFIPYKLDIITDATLYFPKKTQVREKIIDVTQTVSGMPIMEISIDLKHELDHENALEIEKSEDLISQIPFTQKYTLVSNNQLVKKVNYEYSGHFVIPESFESYLMLRSQLPFSLQESYAIDGPHYRLTVLGRPMNFSEYKKDLNIMEDFLRKKGYSFKINGIHHNLMIAQEAMMEVLISSFLSSAIVIFLLSAIFLRSFNDTLIFITVSLIPVALTFGAMKIFGYSLNIATIMTFSISLGMVGDSSFHIIYAKRFPFKSYDEYYRGVLSPVVGSGLLLCTCFCIFTFNSFMPIREFGGILAFILGVGTLADLYILPTLLYGRAQHKAEYIKLIESHFNGKT